MVFVVVGIGVVEYGELLVLVVFCVEVEVEVEVVGFVVG